MTGIEGGTDKPTQPKTEKQQKRKINGNGEGFTEDLPEILCGSGDHARATTEAMALLAAEPDPMAAVYVSGDLLMRPIRLAKPTESGGVTRPEGALVLRQADSDWVRLHLGRRSTWYKFTVSGKEMRRQVIDPPDKVCRNILADAPWPGMPVLAGIIEAPTILPNGRVLQEPGYDRQSGLLFDPGSTKFPKIKDRPGNIDALEAMEILKEPFEKFPFVDDVSMSVALSAVLTVLVRRVLRLAPIFAFDAPTRSSGKTLLASCMGMIATGRNPAIMSHISDPAEERKRLLSLLIEGTPAVLIDNIETQFRSEALNVILTSDIFSDRLLGVSRTVSAATNCMFMASGNNIVIGGDLSTRALICQIDPEEEDPDSRSFETDLPTWLPANRGHIVAAALTIIKAYIEAEEPDQGVPNYGRFKEWQAMCRFPLIWLGMPDPCISREKILSTDPDAGNLKSFISTWFDLFGSGEKTIKSAIDQCEKPISDAKYAESVTMVPLNPNDFLKEESFLNAAKSIGFDKGIINTKKIGWFLAHNERRMVGRLRFEKCGDFRGTVQWKVVDLSANKS